MEVWMSTLVCVCDLFFFNNVLSIWAPRNGHFTKPHNRDPRGGRISHPLLAASPRAAWRKPEIAEDAISGQGGIKLGLLN